MFSEIEQGEEFVYSFLSHGSSRVYDPVKAREYYLRTRELKGRKNRSSAILEANKRFGGSSKFSSKDRQQLSEEHAKKKEKQTALREKFLEKQKVLSKKIHRGVGSAINKRERRSRPSSKDNQRALSNQSNTRSSDRSKKIKDKEQIGEELKATVDTARTKYKELRDGLVSEYEDKYQSEYDAIKATMSKA